MKFCLYSLLFLIFMVSACHRKTVAESSSPTTNGIILRKNANKNQTKNHSQNNNNEVKPLLSNNEAAGETEPAPASPVYNKPVIIVDARGNFAVTDSTLPADASKDILNAANARAYTPAQTKTLAYRFGKVPPRILYVPATLEKKSARGVYYVLDKKFWYWKKSNGYFYIDDNYFK